jgi:hypothetical protein
MGEGRDVYRVLVGEREGKRPLGRPRRRWEDNINRCLKGTSCEDRKRIYLVRHRVKLRAFVNTVMNFRVALKSRGKQSARHCQRPQLRHDSKYPICLACPFSDQALSAHTVLQDPATGPTCGHDEGALLYTPKPACRSMDSIQLVPRSERTPRT